MAAYNHRPHALDRDSPQRPRRASLDPIKKWVATTLLGAENHDPRPDGRQRAGWLADERGTVGEEVLPLFPVARRGYDCMAVDERVAELERELAEADRELVELGARAAPRDEVVGEIKRIGEQTSAVLIAAHEKEAEILRAARAEADRWVADATVMARGVTAQAEARLRVLEAQTETAHGERDRLLDDVRRVAAALAELADAGVRDTATEPPVAPDRTVSPEEPPEPA